MQLVLPAAAAATAQSALRLVHGRGGVSWPDPLCNVQAQIRLSACATLNNAFLTQARKASTQRDACPLAWSATVKSRSSSGMNGAYARQRPIDER